VGRHSYLAAKFLFLGATTAIQSLVLYLGMQLGELAWAVSVAWQCAGLFGVAMASVGIGAAISALARTLMQAVLVVPLVLIPFILFSGYTVPAHDMKPLVVAVSRMTPAFAAQTAMDVSFVWHKQLARETLTDHWTSIETWIPTTN